MSHEEVVGWGRELEHDQTVSTVIAMGLRAIGIEEVFTIIGGGIAPLADAFQKSRFKVRHFRHESGAAFAAHEASVASKRPVAVCVTTGPGLYNALTGIAAAKFDGGHVILLSGATSPSTRGKGAVQETGPDTMPAELFTPGSIFHFAKLVADASELPLIFSKLRSGFQRSNGFIAHLALPLSVQSSPGNVINVPSILAYEPRPSREAIQKVIEVLRGRRFGVWAGYGAINASKELKALVERTGCGVIATPRAKGVFPEHDERYVGVSGAGAHPSVIQYMKEYAPEYLLVLGSKLGEASSFWNPAMVPTNGFIQVDLDEGAFGTGYPSAPNIAIRSEIRAFLEDLIAHLPSDFGQQLPHSCALPRPTQLTPRNEPLVRTPFLLQELQQIVVDGSDAVLLAESGNSFAWANHALRVSAPGRFRTSAAFGSMGHFVTGVVGAALGREGKAVVLAGDGAMLMHNEINTAVTYHAQAVWVVLNDGRFGLTEDGLHALNLSPVETRFPATDFAMFARSQGAQGIVVERESALSSALTEAMSAKGPFVVDVRIDLRDVAPLLAARIASIQKQRGK